MTLDISGKENRLTLNWTGVASFTQWCEEQELPEPFFGWDQHTGIGTINPRDEDDRAKAQEWVDAFEKTFPEQILEGVSGAITDAYRAGYADGGNDAKSGGIKEKNWNLWFATAWCLFLKEWLRKGKGKITYG
jgi:hypothetical protein